MTKAETIMLIIAVAFAALLFLGVGMVTSGSLDSMVFWEGGVMAIMAVFGLIAFFGFKSAPK